MKALRLLPSIVGLGTVGYFAYEQGTNVYYHSINKSEPNFAERYGANCYGIVTGGSYGLGKDYAHELAKRGFNVILIARGKEGLDKTKEEIQSKYPTVDVKTLQFDFTSSKIEDYDKLLNQVNHLDVGILINNVGTYLHGPFHEDKAEGIKNLLITNTFPVSFLTRGLLEKFQKREKRSLLVTVSSEAGDFVHPTHPSYGSSKCYDSHFTRGLQEFYKGSKLDISLLLPGPTKTPLLSKIDDKFAETPYGKAFCAESESSASNSFRKITYQSEIFGDSKHNYFHFMYRFLRPISDYLYIS